MDIGLIVESLRAELIRRRLDTERVLYTDTDVLFADDIDYHELMAGALPTFAAGTEVFSPSMNSGVMLINATAWRQHHASMVAYGERKQFKFLSFDQTWVHAYFTRYAQVGWKALDDAKYNARGFMHPMRPRARAAVKYPRLWHWHGFKPRDVECWLSSIDRGTWPMRAWRDTTSPCTANTRPRCNFMPIANSGCRYFGRLKTVLALSPCCT